MLRFGGRRSGAALICIGFVSGVLGLVAPVARADHGTSPATSCDKSVLKGERDPGLEKEATAEGGDAVVEPGETIEVELTWSPLDWFGIDKVLDCVFVNGAVDESISFEEKPGHNDGIATHSYVIPAGLPDGAEVCDVGRISGNPTPLNATDSTHKSNEVCFRVENPEPAGAVSVDKTPDGGEVAQGQDVEFTIVVTAGGDVDSQDVLLTDDLPDGFDWSIESQSGDACVIDGDGDLECKIGTMSPGDAYSVTVRAATREVECGIVDNTAEVVSDNDMGADDGDVTISRCEEPPPTDGGGDGEPDPGAGPGPEPGPDPVASGPLVISKDVAGVPAGSEDDYTFTFTVDCSDDAFDGSTTITGEGDTTYHAAIPEGVTCTVTESDISPQAEGETWETAVADSDGADDGTVTIADAEGESVDFTNTRAEVAGVVVERPGPDTQVLGQEGASLPRTGLAARGLLLAGAAALVVGLSLLRRGGTA